MNDIEFIDWFFNKRYLFFGEQIKYKFNNQIIKSLIDLISEVEYSIGSNNNIKEYIISKYNDYILEAKNDINDFLNFKYKVSIDRFGWNITNKLGKPIKPLDIVNQLNKKYNDEFILKVIDDWFDNRIIEQSEKNMLDFKFA